MNEVLLIGSGMTVTADAGQDQKYPWHKLREQLEAISVELGGLLEDTVGNAGIPKPDSIAIELGVTATGEVGIIVSKVSVAVGTKITLTFARK